MDIANTSWHNDSGNHTSLQTKYFLSKDKHLQREKNIYQAKKILTFIQVTKIVAEMKCNIKKKSRYELEARIRSFLN
jgi:hypothetical protein